MDEKQIGSLVKKSLTIIEFAMFTLAVFMGIIIGKAVYEEKVDIRSVTQIVVEGESGEWLKFKTSDDEVYIRKSTGSGWQWYDADGGRISKHGQWGKLSTSGLGLESSLSKYYGDMESIRLNLKLSGK